MTVESYKLRRKNRLDLERHYDRMTHIWAKFALQIITILTAAVMALVLVLRGLRVL